MCSTMHSHHAAVNQCLAQQVQQIADVVDRHGGGPLVAPMIRGVYTTALCNLGHRWAAPWSELMLIADPGFPGDIVGALRRMAKDVERGGFA